MSTVPLRRARRQRGDLPAAPPPTVDLSNRAAFVFLVEGREAFITLAEIAREATLPPARRKLSRTEAKRRYQKARADLAWLLDLTPVLAASSCASASEPLFEGWAE